MGFGGTSWGWLPAPVVFTSYDYGAAISEAREVRPKARGIKQLAGLIQSVPDLAGMVPAGTAEIRAPKIQVYHNRARNGRALPAGDAEAVERQTERQLHDHRRTCRTAATRCRCGSTAIDAKWLVAGVNLGGQRLVYSTSRTAASMKLDGDGDLCCSTAAPAKRARRRCAT